MTPSSFAQPSRGALRPARGFTRAARGSRQMTMVKSGPFEQLSRPFAYARRPRAWASYRMGCDVEPCGKSQRNDAAHADRGPYHGAHQQGDLLLSRHALVRTQAQRPAQLVDDSLRALGDLEPARLSPSQPN